MLYCCRLSLISEYVCATNQLLCLLSTSVAAKYFTYFNSFLFLLVVACFYLRFLYHLATYCLHHHIILCQRTYIKEYLRGCCFFFDYNYILLLWLLNSTGNCTVFLGFTLLYGCFIFRSTFSINIKDDST